MGYCWAEGVRKWLAVSSLHRAAGVGADSGANGRAFESVIRPQIRPWRIFARRSRRDASGTKATATIVDRGRLELIGEFGGSPRTVKNAGRLPALLGVAQQDYVG